MRPIVRKFFPEALKKIGWRAVTYIAIKYYSCKFNPLIVRNNTTDRAVFYDIFVLKDYNIPIAMAPRLIIDAGAYVGYASLFFASKYPSAKIVSIEPEDSNFEILEKNTARLPNIKRIKAGLWYRDGFLRMVDRGTGHWGYAVKEVTDFENYDVRAVSINTILENSGFDIIDILKIDIEGSEKELFSQNFDSWIGKVRVIIIEFHDRIKEGCAETVYAAISRYAWREFRRGENIIFVREDLVL